MTLDFQKSLWGCVVSICNKGVLVDFVNSEMVDFVVIQGNGLVALMLIILRFLDT